VGESELDNEVFGRLQEADWDSIYKQLIPFARYRAAYYHWRSGTVDFLAGGKGPDDIVGQVIEKAWDGTRKWDPSQGDLVPWLKWQIKSEIDALAKSATHRYEHSSRSEDEDESDNRIQHQAIDADILSTRPPMTPEEILLRKEATETGLRIAFEAVNGDAELTEIIEALIDGCDPRPRSLAKSLGVPVEDMYNRRKRLNRRINERVRSRNGQA